MINSLIQYRSGVRVGSNSWLIFTTTLKTITVRPFGNRSSGENWIDPILYPIFIWSYMTKSNRINPILEPSIDSRIDGWLGRMWSIGTISQNHVDFGFFQAGQERYNLLVSNNGEKRDLNPTPKGKLGWSVELTRESYPKTIAEPDRDNRKINDREKQWHQEKSEML